MNYRAYSIKNKEYLTDYVLHDGKPVKLSRTQCCLGHLQYVDEFRLSTKNGLFAYEDAVVEYGSGYIDVNGVEVFEGDIISFEWFKFEEQGVFAQKLETAEVYFADYEFHVKIPKWGEVPIFSNLSHIEVVGRKNL